MNEENVMTTNEQEERMPFFSKRLKYSRLAV